MLAVHLRNDGNDVGTRLTDLRRRQASVSPHVAPAAFTRGSRVSLAAMAAAQRSFHRGRGVMMLFSCSSNSTPRARATQKEGPHGSYMSVPLRIPASLDFNPIPVSFALSVSRAFHILRRAVTVVTHLDAICDGRTGAERKRSFSSRLSYIFARE